MANATKSRTSRRAGSQNGSGPSLPGSIATQAQVVCDELERLEYLRTRAVLKQGANGHDDDHKYAAGDDSGEVLTYKQYLAFLDGYERKLKDHTPPAAWRLAQKQLATRASAAES